MLVCKQGSWRRPGVCSANGDQCALCCAIENDFRPRTCSVMPGEFAAVDSLINELYTVNISHSRRSCAVYFHTHKPNCWPVTAQALRLPCVASKAAGAGVSAVLEVINEPCLCFWKRL